jgi:hypothetical protein
MAAELTCLPNVPGLFGSTTSHVAGAMRWEITFRCVDDKENRPPLVLWDIPVKDKFTMLTDQKRARLALREAWLELRTYPGTTWSLVRSRSGEVYLAFRGLGIRETNAGSKVTENRGNRLYYSPSLARTLVEPSHSKSAREKTRSPSAYFLHEDYQFRRIHQRVSKLAVGQVCRFGCHQLSQLLNSDGALRKIAIAPDGSRIRESLFLAGKATSHLEELVVTKTADNAYTWAFRCQMKDGSTESVIRQSTDLQNV